MLPSLPRAPFTLADIPALGLTEADLRRMAKGGEIATLVRGVFVDAALPDSLELRAAAVARAVSSHHIVCDRTAAWLHGVDVHAYGEHDTRPPVEVCALRGHEATHLAGAHGQIRDLAPGDITVIHGVRVTTPLRTALDLGCCLNRREAYAALVGMGRLHGLSQADYARALGRYRRRRGVVQLRELVSLVDPRLESARECWVLLAILDAGLPKPEPQYWIVVDGVPTYRLDFAYKRRRVCVEYDGFEAHEKTREQQAYDERRRNWLRANDWIVIVVRRGDFTGAALDRWLDELRAALAAPYSTRRW